MHMPWMQFHTRDFLDNKELRRCSPAARGVLADLMCLAHEGAPYGYLCDKFGPLSDDYIAARLFVPIADLRHAIIELIRYERLHQEDGKLFIKRMVEDFNANEARRTNGKSGGRPPKNLKPNQVVTIQVSPEEGVLVKPKHEPPSDSDSGYSSDLRNKPSDVENGIPPEPPMPLPSWMLDESFVSFAQKARIFWPRLIDDDLTGAHRWHWTKLSLGERMEATAKLQARIDAGEDGEYVKKLPDYLISEWKRRPREPTKASGPVISREAARRAELMKD